jgi:hypothetical protein
MNGDINLDGVFVSSLLPTVALALAGTFAVRRILALCGVYRNVWHPALFDTALFVILWAASIALTSRHIG